MNTRKRILQSDSEHHTKYERIVTQHRNDNQKKRPLPPIRTGHDVLDQYLPTPEELAEIKRVQKFISEQLQELLNRWAIRGTLVFTGSTALGTFLQGDTDIDLFVVVDVDTVEEFKHVFNRFANLKWIQDQYIKHGHEPDREAMVHRLAIWSGTVKLTQTKRYHLDLIVLPRVGGHETHSRFETLRHVEFFSRNLTAAQKQDVVRLKALFKLGGIYGADQWGIKGVDCQTLIYRHKTIEGALSFLSTLTPSSQLLDPSYEEVRIERDLFVTIFQSPLAQPRLKQIREISTNYLKKRELPPPFDKEEWTAHQAKTRHVVISLPSQGPDRAETFTKAVSVTTHALNQVKGMVEELSDLQADIDARLFEQTTLISFKLHEITPVIQRSLDKRKLAPRQKARSIATFKRNSKQRALPPLITGIQIAEDPQSVTVVFQRNPVFAHFLARRIVQTMLERKGFKLERWVEPPLNFQTIQKHFYIDPQVDETAILTDLERYNDLNQGWGDNKKRLAHTFEVYYTLAVYLRLPHLLGIHETTVKQTLDYFSQKLDGIPKCILTQITALYHTWGEHPPPIGDEQDISSSRAPLIPGRFFHETLGSKLGLTPRQLNYVTTLLIAFSHLPFDPEPHHLTRSTPQLGADFPSLLLLVIADHVVLKHTTVFTLQRLAQVLDHFFASCADPYM
ncbi:MAG: nucleotidyltransferase domain-containing protein [Candidatus Heimdallarchaeota archaeon]